MKFMGYRRPDGRVGIRNHILILPASVCAADTTRIIASQIDGAITFHNQNGCGQVQSDQQLTIDIMAGFAANPNIYGTIVVSLGCENCQMDLVVQAIKARTNKPLKTFIIQECEGTLNTINLAVKEGLRMESAASSVMREECDMSQLIIGTKCGGSDPTSGLSSNVLVGEISDRIVDMGGASILTETPEMIGAEHILASRARTPEIADAIYHMIYRFEDYLRVVGKEEVRESNPSPGNYSGGITTLEEKSLGAIHKSGTRPITAVYDYAQQIHHKGVVIMDSSGHDPSSCSAMAAGGAQLLLYTTGRGTPLGNPIAPVIKLTGNHETYRRMLENMDYDSSPLIDGQQTLKEAGDDFMELIIRVANGEKTKAEQLGYMEIAMDRVCNYT